MDKKELLLLGALFLGCQNEKPEILENISIPEIEVQIEPKKENLEQKLDPPKGEECIINISNNFIPELMSLSRDAPMYFSRKGSLHNPLQQDRLGIFADFKHHRTIFEHYAKAIELRGDQKQPKIELPFVPYTTEKTIKKISALEIQSQDDKLPEKDKGKVKQELDTLQKQLQEVKNIQQILQWEDFYKGDITGIYDPKTSAAIIKYQKFHRARLLNPIITVNDVPYELKADGSISKPTRTLLNRDFEEYAFAGVRRTLEERVFHAKCNGRYPYVIEQPELHKLVTSAAEQLKLDTIQGVQEFLSAEHENVTVYLEIPERYQQEFMKLEVEVEKWEKDRRKSKLRLYTIEEGERIEIFQTKAVVGGKVKNKKTGGRKDYDTPEGEYYLKNVLFMPYWNPPDWAALEGEIEDEEKLPGPFNAFGMILAPLYLHDKPQKKPFATVQDGYNGWGNHLTRSPFSVENGGASHSCVRLHPTQSRYFYFIIGYTLHELEFEDFEGRETIKFVPLRGSNIPFEPGHYIKERICEKECE